MIFNQLKRNKDVKIMSTNAVFIPTYSLVILFKRPYILAEERFCKQCNLDLVEDEFHCMMLCNNWKDLRLDLFQTACKTIEHFAVLSPKTQFHQILNNKNPDMIIALGKFLNMVLKMII